MIFDPSLLSVAQLRERFLVRNRKLTREGLRMLLSDPREGVRKIAEILAHKLEAERLEKRRVSRLLRTERELWESGINLIAGVDEAGIGPLAGPVVAAAVVFPPGTRILNIDDSKRLLPAERAELACEIQKKALAIGVGMADVQEIDTINIYHAGLAAMRRAVEALGMQPEHVLVDARRIPGIPFAQTGIIHGDALCFSIAAASIIAKVQRDRLMEAEEVRFPGYGFCSHKGYSTPAHKQAIRQNGPCELHRRSFLYVREVHGDCSPLFYSLLAQMYAAPDLAGLSEVEEGWNAFRDELSDYEQKKFRDRLMRRRKRLAAEVQKGTLGPSAE